MRYRRPYDLAQQQNVLASHKEYASADVCVDVLDKDSFNCVLEDEIRCHDSSLAVCYAASPRVFEAYRIDPNS